MLQYEMPKMRNSNDKGKRRMNLLNLLEEVKENSPSISILDLKNINKNIELFLKTEADLDKDNRDKFLETIVKMLQDLSKKIKGENKYDRFIRKLVDSDELHKTLLKVIDFNKKLIKIKEGQQ